MIRRWAVGIMAGSFRQPTFRAGTNQMTAFGSLLVVVLTMSSCGSLRSLPSRGVEINPPEVISSTLLGSSTHRTLGMAKFTSSTNAAGAIEWLTRIYTERLMQEGPFRQIRPLDASPSNIGEAILLGRAQQCELVLVPSVVSLIESSGAMPTELQVSVQLVEVSTGRVLIFIRQRARSQPGADIDLVWNIVEGQPALRSRELAEKLASQHAQFMASLAGPPLSPGGK